MDPYRSCEESEDHGRLRWVLLREVGFEARLWHAGSSSGSSLRLVAIAIGQARFMPGLMCAMRARQKGNVEGLKRGNGANARAESASILDATVSTAPTFVSRKMFIQLIYWPSGLV
jgi:hypothetical protein